MTFLAFSAITICVFLIILLLSKENKKQSDLLLTAWLVVTAAELAIFHIDYNWLYPRYQWTFGLKTVFPFLHAPLIALFALSLIKGKRSNLTLGLNFIPAGIYLMSLVPYWLLDRQKKADTINQLTLGDDSIFTGFIAGIVIIAYVAAYLFYSLNLTRTSRNESQQVKWLHLLLTIYVALWISIAAMSFIVIFKAPEYYQTLSAISLLGFTLFIWCIAIIGIKDTQIFLQVSHQFDKVLSRRYQKSGLSKENASTYLNQLLEYLEAEKPYLDSRLSLKKLSIDLGISENHLSQTINEKLNCNFFDLINEYRIKEFKNQVTQNENDYLTLFAIAQACGFNSKSTFNIAFKKMTGVTPSQYKAQISELIPN